MQTTIASAGKPMSLLRAIFLPILLVFASACAAQNGEPCIPKITETLHGKCVVVKDGDTVSVLVNKQMITVRFEGVDAPEKGQDHGTKATQALTDWIKGKDVSIGVTGTDRYGRTLGIVHCDGVNINEKLLAEGWAWQYLQYNCDDTWAALQKSAQLKKSGLWTHGNAIPPWEFRRLERERVDLQRQRTAESSTQPMPAITPAVKERKETKPAASYWLNTSGNVRHNSRCRYYHNTKKGRSCGPNEGKACGICGG